MGFLYLAKSLCPITFFSIAWRKKNPNYQKERYRKGREFVHNYKKNHPCVECGESDYRCLDFHHEGKKGVGNGGMCRLYIFSSVKIQAEIDECIILCANCHRKHHFSKKSRTKE